MKLHSDSCASCSTQCGSSAAGTIIPSFQVILIFSSVEKTRFAEGAAIDTTSSHGFTL